MSFHEYKSIKSHEYEPYSLGERMGNRTTTRNISPEWNRTHDEKYGTNESKNNFSFHVLLLKKSFTWHESCRKYRKVLLSI